MPKPLLDLFVLPIVLGCSAVSSAQGSPPGGPQDQEPAFEPIRFGDPQALSYDAPFFPGARHDPAIPTPDSILGQHHGTRLSHHAEILACFRAWAASSDRIRVETFGRTHEGRELVWAAITSPANQARLDGIRADMARLADPRDLSEAEERRILGGPAVAWMGYSIHGDELSGSDAAVALGYHLVASQDPEVAELLDQLVVVIDPCLNPDGRERIIGMVEQSAGLTPSLDYASMHRGRWPWGRGNHYLFDMNRDWMAGTQPETRARWGALLSFHPQLFVDAHEMGSDETFLFYPQAKPLNPQLPTGLTRWQQLYAADAAHAFDREGWAYYTREWADAWGPFYSDSWASLTGATGILYEQANTMGSALQRPSGRVLTYREAVHHQLSASWANLGTLRAHRQEALRDYVENGRANVAAETPGNGRVLVVRPSGNHGREREFLGTLLGQGIEVRRAEADFTGHAVVTANGEHSDEAAFPAGCWLVPARQPARQLVRAFLDFDVRYDSEALQREREELERKGRSRAYDVTSWCLVHALALDAAWIDEPGVSSQALDGLPPGAPALPERVAEPAPVGWIVDGADDDVLAFTARALDLGLAVHWADEAFSAAGRPFARGSVLVRRSENAGTPQEVWEQVRSACSRAGVEVVPAPSGLAPDLEQADLGGQHFRLLARPRVALVANSPVSSDGYGHLWHHLDRHVGVPFSILDAQELGSVDLRRFNVLVLPPSYGLEGLLEPLSDSLGSWIEGGGTLIACGKSAAALSKGRLGLSQVVLRRDALEDLESYRRASTRERAARHIVVDESALWDGAGGSDASAQAEEPDSGDAAGAEKPDPEILAEEDEHARRFAPQGATLRGIVDPDAWITSGCADTLPVLSPGAEVLMSKPPVTTAVRLDQASGLRLAGLVWPEARERLAESAWLTVERRGHGQIVLFAAQPAFRGYHLASARLFANAVVLGPGLGAEQPVGW